MGLRDTVVKRLASNASLDHKDAGAMERLINAIVKDIDALNVKNPVLGIRTWNRVEWKLPVRNFSTAKNYVAVWKSMFIGIKREVMEES